MSLGETSTSSYPLLVTDSSDESEENEGLEWIWDRSLANKQLIVGTDGIYVYFHPHSNSSGTAVVRGTKPLSSDQHFWEIELLSGTDMNIGVGTSEVDVSLIRNNATSYLGSNDYTWGLEASGLFRHNRRAEEFCSYFQPHSVIGVHLDMWHGTLSFYKNHTFLGIASTGLSGKELYPMISSVAKPSAIRIVRSSSFPTSLQYLCCAKLREHIPDEKNVLEELPFPAGLHLFLKEKLGWLLEQRNSEPEGRQFTPELSRVRLYEINVDDPNVVQGVFRWGTNTDAYVQDWDPTLETVLVMRRRTTPMFELEEFEGNLQDTLQRLVTRRLNYGHRFRSLEEQIHHEDQPRLEVADPSLAHVEPEIFGDAHIEADEEVPPVIFSETPQPFHFHLAQYEVAEEERNTSGEDRLTFMDMHAFRERNAEPNADRLTFMDMHAFRGERNAESNAEQLLSSIIKSCQVPEDDVNFSDANLEAYPQPNLVENPFIPFCIIEEYQGGRDDSQEETTHVVDNSSMNSLRPISPEADQNDAKRQRIS